MDRLDANIEYLKENGEVTFHLGSPMKEHSICQFTIEVKTPLDPYGKCAIRMDMDFVNHYKIGSFNEPQQLECDFDVKDLKALSAFPKILEVLTNTQDELLRISTVLLELERHGFKKGSRVDGVYKQLQEAFDRNSQPYYTQELNVN